MAPICVRSFPDSPPAVLETLFSSVRDLVLVIDRTTDRIVFANDSVRELLGWRDQELTALGPWFNLMSDPQARECWRQALHRAADSCLSGADPGSFDPPGETLPLRTSGGCEMPIAIHTIGCTDDRIVLFATPSSELSPAEELVRQTLARFRSIVDSLSICLVLKDREGRRIYANPAYLELRQFELKDVLGKTDFDLFPEDLATEYSADDRRILETGEVIHKFEENVDRHGKRTWTEIIKGPLRDADGNITGIQILFWDATDRKQTEQELERERYLLHALLDNVPDSIYFKDRESRFVRVSRGMAQKFHLEDPQAIIGKTDADIFTEEHARQAREDELRIMATGEPMVGLVERETWPDRPDTWCSTTKLPLYDSAGRIVGTFGISRDITDMIEAEQQLREARDAADRANRAKSEFLANMSHEIRTPMNGIIGMTELLKHTQLEDDQQSFVEMIEQSAQSLLRIINDILDFSKIEAGKLELEKRAFDLRRCVSHAAKSLAVRAAEKSLELVLEMDPDVPECVLGDPDRLRQILVNLVGNSIKFTHQGEIAIRVSVAHGPPASPRYTLQFSVQDTGIGIPPSKQKSIFEAFTQADLSTTRQYGGTGLGLSISSQLVAMMGGSIWLESEVGVGTTFFFTVPFDAADVPDEEETAEALQSMKDFRVLLIDDNATNRETLSTSLARRGMIVQSAGNAEQAEALYAQLANYDADRCAVIVDQDMPERSGLALLQTLTHRFPTFRPLIVLLTSSARPPSSDLNDRFRLAAVLQKPALHNEICHALRRAISREADLEMATSTPAPAPQGPPLHFLLAEDGAVNRAVFEGLLTRYGHKVTTVEDGVSAVDAWRDFEFDAILMDVQMPQMDGIQATRLIRKEEEQTGRHTPIIAITAAAMQGDQQRCLDAGMDDYLSKPVDINQLTGLFEKLWHGAFDPNSSGITSGNAAPPADQTGRPPPTAAPTGIADFDAPVRRMRCTPEQHRQLLMTLRDEASQRLIELSTALDNNDPKLLIRAAHSLKSAAAMFRATAVAESSAHIERHARSGDIGAVRKEFSHLRQHVNELLQALNLVLQAQS
ncbi:MAG: response regulator [Planctomycetota bacterium]|nr:MAG: response regulator [Planctomycetota bacterium]